MQVTYTAGSGVSSGDTECISIEIIDDDDVEGSHRFGIEIKDVTLGTISAESSFTSIDIQDNIGRFKLMIIIPTNNHDN